MHFAFGGERECKNASPLSSNASAASNHLAFAPPLGTEGGAAEPRRSQPCRPRGRRRPPEHPNRRRPSSSSAALVKLVHRGSSTAGRPPSSSSSAAGRELVRALEAGEPEAGELEAGAPDASRTRQGPARILPERAPPPREASTAGLHCGSPAAASHEAAEGAPPLPRGCRRREPRRGLARAGGGSRAAPARLAGSSVAGAHGGLVEADGGAGRGGGGGVGGVGGVGGGGRPAVPGVRRGRRRAGAGGGSGGRAAARGSTAARSPRRLQPL